jgi:peptidoglycan/LPS O-acetylase OafA/YrhL
MPSASITTPSFPHQQDRSVLSYPPKTTPRQAPRSSRYDSLDLWRGVACLAVVIYHSSGAGGHTTHGTDILSRIVAFAFDTCAWMWLGVPMFFVISGYCIAATADGSRRRSQGAKKYFLRRFRRIYPPYWAILAIMALYVLVARMYLPEVFWAPYKANIYKEDWTSVSSWLGNITLTETWRPYIFGDGRGHFVGQAWTLCYEEQFYALTGLILLLAPRRFFPITAVITSLVFIIQWVSLKSGVDVTGFFFDGQWLLFALGVLVYYRINYANRWQGWTINVGLVALIIFCRFCPIFFNQYAMFFGACFALLLSLCHRFDKQMSAATLFRPLFWCGTMCYSLYLVHGIVLKFVMPCLASLAHFDDVSRLLVLIPICSLLSVAAGWSFYICVERHFINPPQAVQVQ